MKFAVETLNRRERLRRLLGIGDCLGVLYRVARRDDTHKLSRRRVVRAPFRPRKCRRGDGAVECQAVAVARGERNLLGVEVGFRKRDDVVANVNAVRRLQAADCGEGRGNGAFLAVEGGNVSYRLAVRRGGIARRPDRRRISRNVFGVSPRGCAVFDIGDTAAELQGVIVLFAERDFGIGVGIVDECRSRKRDNTAAYREAVGRGGAVYAAYRRVSLLNLFLVVLERRVVGGGEVADFAGLVNRLVAADSPIGIGFGGGRDGVGAAGDGRERIAALDDDIRRAQDAVIEYNGLVGQVLRKPGQRAVIIRQSRIQPGYRRQSYGRFARLSRRVGERLDACLCVFGERVAGSHVLLEGRRTLFDSPSGCGTCGSRKLTCKRVAVRQFNFNFIAEQIIVRQCYCRAVQGDARNGAVFADLRAALQTFDAYGGAKNFFFIVSGGFAVRRDCEIW